MKSHAEAVAALTGKPSKRQGGTARDGKLIREMAAKYVDEDGAVCWSLFLPLQLRTEANTQEHWRVKYKRAKHQRDTARLTAQRLIGKWIWNFPLKITIARMAPRALDSDNLARSAKAVRDGIADWLGIDDRDPCVIWEYDQMRHEPKTYGVKVKIRRARP